MSAAESAMPYDAPEQIDGANGTTVQLPVALEVRVVTGAGGGPDKTILNTPRFLRQYGFRTVCAYMRPPEDVNFARLRQRAETWQAPLIEIDDRGPWDWTIVRRLIDICRSERVAIWHGHDYKSNLLGLLVRRFWPMRLVTTVHGWVKRTSRTPLYYALDRLSLKSYERVICVSEDLRNTCLSAGVPQSRCVVVDNAIDTREFVRVRSSREAKKRLGFRPDRLLIGAVGRLSREKGFDLLVRAAAQLSDVDFDLCIAGEGDQREELETLIQSLGCSDRIHVLGFRADTIDLYQAMDLFVLSSLREGLPNVLLEAMALDVPVIATRIAGVPDLIDDKQDGVLIEPGNISDLKTALKRLILDGQYRERLAMAARDKIEKNYSFEMRTRKVAAIYDQLLREATA